MSDALVRTMRRDLRAAANPEKAVPMAAYMKTDMPFHGVQKGGRTAILRAGLRAHPCASRAAVKAAAQALWVGRFREEKYLAVALLREYPAYITLGSVPLYRRLIVEGAWWDFVDEVATKLIGRVLRDERAAMSKTLDRWIDGDDMWLRRTAIIAQLGHKEATDVERLFDYCRRRAHEPEFFIRKAIGWALREHAKTDAAAVRRFLRAHGDELSTLSRREAGKHL